MKWCSTPRSTRRKRGGLMDKLLFRKCLRCRAATVSIFQLIFTNQRKEVKLWEYYLYHFCFWLLSAVPILTSPGTGQLYTNMTARRWLTKIASNRNSHTYTLILIPSLIGELLLKKRGWENKEESDEVIYMSKDEGILWRFPNKESQLCKPRWETYLKVF
jgi:cell division protein FtsW (lipid II flippase)